MKHRIIPFLALVLLLVSAATAQGEWKWAHYWSGQDGSYSSYYNKIVNTAFDDDGNIYVYGSMGVNAVFDGELFQFSTNAQVLNWNDRSILLAKFDTLGNMLWHKVVKSSSEMAFPLWMEVKDNKVHIAGNCGFYGFYYDSWLYYLDTLILKYQIDSIPADQQRPPFKTNNRWTFFATLDADGHLIEDHFVSAYSRELYPHGNDSIRREYNLCTNNLCPVHVGDDGSVYVYTPIQYQGDECDPYTIVVDGDTSKSFDLFWPGSVGPLGYINNAVLYKFSPDWNLEVAKLTVAQTDGMNPSYNGLFHVFFSGMSFDEEDNMYLTGYADVPRPDLHDYPVHFWWDSTHYMTMNDISSAEGCNFIVKYDTDGNVVWSNQLYSRGTQTVGEGFARAYWFRNTYHNGTIYILGGAAYENDGVALIYFDDEINPLQRFQEEPSDITFFVQYNTQTGNYITHGIVPAEDATSALSLTVMIDRIFTLSKYLSNNYLLTEWDNTGYHIKSDTIHSNGISIRKTLGPEVNKNGLISVTLTTTAPIFFDNDTYANCPLENSSAVLTLYHDPRLAEPFVPDDTVDIAEYQHNRESDIYLYPNPTNGEAVVCGYMYDYRNIELFDLQGRKLADLVDNCSGTSLPVIDLTPYPAGTYLVHINFNRGVSVTRKVVKAE